MGAGIAQVSAAAGFNVMLVDTSTAALSKAMKSIDDSLKSLARREAKASGAPESNFLSVAGDALARISQQESLNALSSCDLVIEAVPETMEIKTPLYAKLGKLLRQDAILASNTSGLSVGALAKIAQRPTTTIGLHC